MYFYHAGCALRIVWRATSKLVHAFRHEIVRKIDRITVMQRSNEQGEKYREIGKDFLARGKFFDAFVSFNKSLCFAEENSEEISLTFAARSEAFFECELFEKCLKNLQAARRGFLSGELLEKLTSLEVECKKKLSESDNDSKDFDGFFDLSYPPNAKIPFIVDGLELRRSEKFGRYVITTRDLQPGDIIAVEQPHFAFLSPTAVFEKCFNCLRSNMLDLYPGNSFAMFCSEKCRLETDIKFNGKAAVINSCLTGSDITQKMIRIMSEALHAAGSFEELKTLVASSSDKNIFDFDVSDVRDAQMKKIVLSCVNSLIPKQDVGIADYLKDGLSLPEGDRKDFFVSFIAKIVLIYMRNGVKLPGREGASPDGGLLLAFVPMINHSCDPNLNANFMDNKCILTVMRPIASGEQLFVNYR